MLPVSWGTIRLFIHVAAATVWVGGQLVLAGLVPGLRTVAEDAPRAAARRFNLIAWPAYVVLIATGIWNVIAVDPSFDSAYGRTLTLKVAVAIFSGLAAALHSISRSKAGLAVWGALSGLAAVGALFLGVLLAEF
jgi:putative copper export protein